MPIREAPRVAISVLGRATARTLLFRAGGQLRVAAVVKAVFVLAQDGAMIRSDPEPIESRDRHRERDPRRSLQAVNDLVPYRLWADVLLTGHARAPIAWPTPRLGIRLMVARGDEMLIDKRLAVQGPPDAEGAPAPFTSIPLDYEHAARGTDNPAGVAVESGAQPSILDRWHRAEPVGYGPIGAAWPSRRRLLRDPEALRAPIPALPADFPWEYFSAAPPDQRIAFLQGDEWVGFEGMNSQIPRVQSYLPRARGMAKLYGPEPGLRFGRDIALVADTLAIDADRLRAAVVWRGSFPVSSEAALADLRVFAGVETATAPLAFPISYEAACAYAPVRVRAGDVRATLDMSPDSIDLARDAPTLPFERREPLPPREPSAKPLPPATPFEALSLWGSQPSRTPIPPPPEEGDDAVHTIDVSPDVAAMLRAAATPFETPGPPPAVLPIEVPADIHEAEAPVAMGPLATPSADAPRAEAPESPPKTLGEHFLAAIGRI